MYHRIKSKFALRQILYVSEYISIRVQVRAKRWHWITASTCHHSYRIGCNSILCISWPINSVFLIVCLLIKLATHLYCTSWHILHVYIWINWSQHSVSDISLNQDKISYKMRNHYMHNKIKITYFLIWFGYFRIIPPQKLCICWGGWEVNCDWQILVKFGLTWSALTSKTSGMWCAHVSLVYCILPALHQMWQTSPTSLHRHLFSCVRFFKL